MTGISDAAARSRATRRLIGAGVALLLVLGRPIGLSAQEAGGAIEGIIRASSDSLPVGGATVQLVGTPFGVLTDDAGTFRIVRVAPGSYELRVTVPGFEPLSLDVIVASGESAGVEAYVTPAVIDVPGIVVTASRSRERPGEAPVSVAVLDGGEIERRNVNTVGEALPFAQGVVANAGQLDIRGASGISRGVGSRVLVLLDGHRMQKGVGSEADFEMFPLLDVERVEVVKGPHSSLYGTGALGGVVNVITSVPSQTPETLVRGYFGAYDTPSRFRFTDESLSTLGIGVQHKARRLAGFAFANIQRRNFPGRSGAQRFARKMNP